MLLKQPSDFSDGIGLLRLTLWLHRLSSVPLFCMFAACVIACAFAGTRAIPTCLETERYYESIDTCVNEIIYANPQFITALTSHKVCSGGLIVDYLALEALRDCEVITSSLTIAVADVHADYSALFLIREIQGSYIYY